MTETVLAAIPDKSELFSYKIAEHVNKFFFGVRKCNNAEI